MSSDSFRFWTFVLVLLFLLNGDPDLWDMMHKAAMNYFKGRA
jgi:hypothetical protein